jgi:hypothetical protein
MKFNQIERFVEKFAVIVYGLWALSTLGDIIFFVYGASLPSAEHGWTYLMYGWCWLIFLMFLYFLLALAMFDGITFLRVMFLY